MVRMAKYGACHDVGRDHMAREESVWDGRQYAVARVRNSSSLDEGRHREKPGMYARAPRHGRSASCAELECGEGMTRVNASYVVFRSPGEHDRIDGPVNCVERVRGPVGDIRTSDGVTER